MQHLLIMAFLLFFPFSVKNRLQFAADQVEAPVFPKPINPSDLTGLFHLVSIAESTWPAIVKSLVATARRPDARYLWNNISHSVLILGLYTVGKLEC